MCHKGFVQSTCQVLGKYTMSTIDGRPGPRLAPPKSEPLKGCATTTWRLLLERSRNGFLGFLLALTAAQNK